MRLPVVHLPEHEAVIALGGNVGDVPTTLLAAIAAIGRLPTTTLVSRSRLYDTAPVGPEQPRYCNAAIRIHTFFGPHDLLECLLAIERSLGRERSRETRWGPRTVDLDLIVYEDLVLETEPLVLPHPRAFERAFVVAPLVDVVPEAEATLRPLLASLGGVPDVVAWPDSTRVPSEP